MATAHTVDAPGAPLSSEVRGSGPLLLVLGAPMSAAHFAPLADALAGDHTVVTTDPRGISGSPVDDPEQDSTPDLRADDVAAILDDLGADAADVFGSSGGAVTGLALVARHPSRVRTLVAHEPPLLTLLPDAAEQLAMTDEIVATCHRDGPGAAFAKFMAQAGFVGGGDESGDDESGGDDGAPVPQEGESSEEELRDGVRFLTHELSGTVRYAPDVDALTAGPARVVVGLGADSGALLTQHTTTALTTLLGTEPTIFPGDHGGFLGQPAEFAEALRKALAG